MFISPACNGTIWVKKEGDRGLVQTGYRGPAVHHHHGRGTPAHPFFQIQKKPEAYSNPTRNL